MADNLTEGGLRYIFRVQPNGKAMATVTMSNIAEMAKAANMPVKRVAMMHEDGNFGTTMGNHVEAFGKPARLRPWCSAFPTASSRRTSPPSCRR